MTHSGAQVNLTITSNDSTYLFYLSTTLNAGTATEVDHVWFGAVGQ